VTLKKIFPGSVTLEKKKIARVTDPGEQFRIFG
jgi:hypothetical protein